MDALLASLDVKGAAVQAESRAKADDLLADLRKKRDAFRSTMEAQAQAGGNAWGRIKTQLEADWAKFNAEADSYLESFIIGTKQLQSTFQGLMGVQLKAWRDMADQVQAASAGLTAERRRDIDATAARIKADATAAEQTLQKLVRAGAESWSTFNTALSESRAAFDRASQSARDAFK
jgi:hypothetical protein